MKYKIDDLKNMFPGSWKLVDRYRLTLRSQEIFGNFPVYELIYSSLLHGHFMGWAFDNEEINEKSSIKDVKIFYKKYFRLNNFT